MNQALFRNQAKNWLNNKIILSVKSQWYNIPVRRDAIYHIKSRFSDFLTFPNNYNVGQLALKIKRNEDLLMVILPNPHNASYNQALQALTDLLKIANDFITQYNLQSVL